MKPSKHKMTVLSQIFKLIPRNLIPKLANEFGIDRQSRVFSPTSHVLALVFGQLTHAGGAYVTVTGRVRHISVPEKTLVMEDGTVIGLEDIAAISGFQFEI